VKYPKIVSAWTLRLEIPLKSNQWEAHSLANTWPKCFIKQRTCLATLLSFNVRLNELGKLNGSLFPCLTDSEHAVSRRGPRLKGTIARSWTTQNIQSGCNTRTNWPKIAVMFTLSNENIQLDARCCMIICILFPIGPTELCWALRRVRDVPQKGQVKKAWLALHWLSDRSSPRRSVSLHRGQHNHIADFCSVCLLCPDASDYVQVSWLNEINKL
jgi:hypothetical protein